MNATTRKHISFAFLLFVLFTESEGRAFDDPPKAAAQSAQVSATGETFPHGIARLAPIILPASSFATQEPIRLIVRSASHADIERERYRSNQNTAGSLAAFGAGSAGLGVSVAPMFGGALLLGGVFVGIGAAAVLSSERAQQTKIEAGLKQTNFIEKLTNRFDSTLVISQQADAPSALEVVALRYGIVESVRRDELCVVAELGVTLVEAGQEIYHDRILLSPYTRSADAPPPVCLSRKNMAEDDANAVHEAFKDYAITIPAIVKQRIGGLPWKPP